MVKGAVAPGTATVRPAPAAPTSGSVEGAGSPGAASGTRASQGSTGATQAPMAAAWGSSPAMDASGRTRSMGGRTYSALGHSGEYADSATVTSDAALAEVAAQAIPVDHADGDDDIAVTNECAPRKWQVEQLLLAGVVVWAWSHEFVTPLELTDGCPPPPSCRCS